MVTPREQKLVENYRATFLRALPVEDSFPMPEGWDPDQDQRNLESAKKAFEAATINRSVAEERLKANLLDGKSDFNLVEKGALESVLESPQFDPMGAGRYFSSDLRKMKRVLQSSYVARKALSEQRKRTKNPRVVAIQIEFNVSQYFPEEVDELTVGAKIIEGVKKYFQLDGEPLPIQFVLQKPEEDPYTEIFLSDQPIKSIMTSRKRRIAYVRYLREVGDKEAKDYITMRVAVALTQNPQSTYDDMYDTIATDPELHRRTHFGSDTGGVTFKKAEGENPDDLVFIQIDREKFERCNSEGFSTPLEGVDAKVENLAEMIAHEIGHTFGFKHPFSSGAELLEKSLLIQPLKPTQPMMSYRLCIDPLNFRPMAFTPSQQIDMSAIPPPPRKGK